MLYPAFLFAFLSLMLATFDSIMYGDAAEKVGNTWQERCAGVDSMFCHIAKIRNFEPCRGIIGNITPDFGGYADIFSENMVMLCLFAFLFYLFMGTIADFLAALLQVVGFDMAKGSINVVNIAIAAKTGGLSLVKKAAEAAKNQINKSQRKARIRRRGG